MVFRKKVANYLKNGNYGKNFSKYGNYEELLIKIWDMEVFTLFKGHLLGVLNDKTTNFESLSTSQTNHAIA